MLKFLRKYQMILLAVGGSLLMVVFLLEPVLGQLTPDPRKKTVATLGDGTKVTLGDQVRASAELEILERFLGTLPPALGLDAEDPASHWVLLKHEAERLGVMGVQLDGASWIPELADELAQGQLTRMQQQRQQITPEIVEMMFEQTRSFLQQRKELVLRGNQLSEASLYEILSTARGVLRLRELYAGAARWSRPRAAGEFERAGTAVLVDQLVLGPELLDAEVPEPTDVELAAHLAAYRDRRPGEADGDGLGFGYLLPARVKIEWLALSPERIAESVTPDPVQVRRRWQEQTDQSVPFNDARAGIEAEIKRERVGQILVDADEVIRGEILAATRGLEKEGIYRVLPEGWTPPDLEKIAGDVVNAIQERHGVRITRPEVNRRTDRWLTPDDLQQLPGVGRAVFRAGARQASVAEIPSMVRGVGESTTVAVQVGLPIMDTLALGPDGSKYFITVLDAAAESPPAGVDEIRETLVRDVRALRAYEEHVSRMSVYLETAARDGLAGLAAMFPGPDGQSRVTVRDNVFVGEEGLAPAFRSFPDYRADSDAFREAVLTAADGLDPLAAADTLPLAEGMVGVPVPSARVVAFARVRALVPATLDDFRVQGGRIAQTVRSRSLAEAQGQADPLRLESLSSRLGFERVGAERAEEAATPAG